MSNRCVVCGVYVPEGRHVCPQCESGRKDKDSCIEDMVIIAFPWYKDIPKELRKRAIKEHGLYIAFERLYNAGFHKN